MQQSETTMQQAVLVALIPNIRESEAAERSLDELERLLETAGGHAFARMIQVKEHFDPRTCIGSGKAEELRDLIAANEIGLVVFDFELSPSQIRNLEDILEPAEVIDRSMLILDIFALHARSGEGKLQVELAQLKYTAPRLLGKGTHLSRLGGGIGTRGPGESKLETDRRHLQTRIRSLERALEELASNRSTVRAARDKHGMPQIAIVGYTNAGKSSLLNRLTDAGVLSQDQLFATLDPTTRKLETDRRHLQTRIRSLERALEELASNRSTLRAARDKHGMPQIAIVGYTNAGKSSLLNRLTDAGVLSQDQLFATLDPTTRKLELAPGEEVLLTDTVGFIRKLPHHLIHAFRSTLDEAVYADMLWIVADASDPECEQQLEVTRSILAELGAADKPTLLVYNKCDLLQTLPEERDGQVFISSKTGAGIGRLLEKTLLIVNEGKRRVTLVIPYEEQGVLSALYSQSQVHEVQYEPDGIYVTATLDRKTCGACRRFLKEER